MDTGRVEQVCVAGGTVRIAARTRELTVACPDCGRELARVHSAVGGRPVLGVGVLPLARAGLGAAVVPTLALTGAPPETVALPTVPVAGHRRIAAVWPTSPSGPQPRTAAVVEALRQSAENLRLRPTP